MKLSLALLLSGMFLAPCAHADTVFYFHDTRLASGGTVTGSVTIDTVNDGITDSNVTVGGVTFLGGQDEYESYNTGFFGNPARLDFASTDGLASLEIYLPRVAGLTGYTGGDICTTSSSMSDCGGVLFANPLLAYSFLFTNAGGNDGIVSGSLSTTPDVAVTPEPASIALLGTGLVGMASVVRRRFTASS